MVEAKEVLSQKKVKCVVSDFKMPGEDGVALLKYVKENFPETSRILITGENAKTLPKEAVTKAKIDEILEKPISESTLNKVISYAQKSKIKETKKEIDFKTYRPKDWHIEKSGEFEIGDEPSDILEGDGELILVVDDLKDMRSLISRSLKKKNFRIVTASDGEEALCKARQHQPDLIIIDWMMPKKSGVDLIEDLKNEPGLSHIPTVLLTAKSDEESKLIGTKTGASAYMGKPFDELELFSTVDNLLNLKKGEKKIKELNRELSENVLKRFLPPTLVDSIASGKSKIDSSYSRHTITVMFTDICSFTSISDEVGPQKMAQILNMYLDEMTKVIFEFGGTIDKIMGDSIMAIWGAPEKLDDEEQISRAYNCSIEINKKLAELNTNWKAKNLPELNKRIGIHQGPAIVGYFGGRIRSDYTAIGRTINKAQRIESVATPGEIFISDVVRDILPESAKWEKAGTFDLKGVSKEETLYRIIK